MLCEGEWSKLFTSGSACIETLGELSCEPHPRWSRAWFPALAVFPLAYIVIFGTLYLASVWGRQGSGALVHTCEGNDNASLLSSRSSRLGLAEFTQDGVDGDQARDVSHLSLEEQRRQNTDNASSSGEGEKHRKLAARTITPPAKHRPLDDKLLLASSLLLALVPFAFLAVRYTRSDVRSPESYEVRACSDNESCMLVCFCS